MEPGADRTGATTLLFVDLDGTLVATDLLWESLFHLLRDKPWLLLWLPLWLTRGRAALKHEVASRCVPDASRLPYRREVLNHIEGVKNAGGQVVLATASDKAWADAVAEHLGIFDAVLASTPVHNLKGANKLEAMRAHAETLGASSWGYMGDSSADLAIWRHAPQTYVVYARKAVIRRAQQECPEVAVIGRRPGALRSVVKALRPHQWAKNVLLLLPLFLAHEIGNAVKLWHTLLGFATFCACASSVYVLNDLLDVEADRLHPRKSRRPFASGALPLVAAAPMALGLVTVGLGVAAWACSPTFLAVLLLYMTVTTLYSTILKSKLLIDVFVLAGLYTLRIFAGGVAAELSVSQWLLAFSIFLFSSLAFAKRYVEMDQLVTRGETRASGRGYQTSDLSLLETMGVASGYIAVLVFALYIQSGLPRFYTQVWMLWLSCPLILYWIARLWFMAKRGQLHDDPVVFAITDRGSLAVGALVAVLMVLAGL